MLEKLTGRTFDVLHIVGGGSNVKLLNQLTADVIGKPVIAGPGEATALGNLMVQLISVGLFDDLAAARQWLVKEQELETYQPQPTAANKHLKQYQKMVL